jgi:hypothetical protein
VSSCSTELTPASSTPGPNAPLSDACGNSTQPLANAYASVSSWTQAGLDPSQITIGVPAYGYLQQSWATSLRQRDLPSNSTMWPMRDRRGMEKRFTTVSSGWSTTEGQVMWHDLVSQGALQKQWDGQWVGGGGFDRIWDECSSTVSIEHHRQSNYSALFEIDTVRTDRHLRRPSIHVAEGPIRCTGWTERVQRLQCRWGLDKWRVAFDGCCEIRTRAVIAMQQDISFMNGEWTRSPN